MDASIDYLMNAWYVAAWSEDLKDRPIGRRLLDIPVVLFRRSDGQPAALLDRCPHRFAPLSLGKVADDQIRCGYHGLRVRSDGTCVDERLTKKACEAARVRSFPVVDRDSAVWIWLGDPALADPGRIMDFGFLEDSRLRTIRGTTLVKANYMLEIDNLMDLSHLDFVHLGSIANGGLTTGEYSWREEGEAVHTCWWAPDSLIPPQFVRNMPGVDRVDQWTEFRWTAPATLFLYNGATRVGAPRTEGIEVWQGHFVTPQTARSSVYFWSVALKAQYLPPEAVDETIAVTRKAFEGEDRPMLEAQQANMKGVDLWTEKPVYFPEDAGAVRVRRILESLIQREKAASSTTQRAGHGSGGIRGAVA